MGPKLRETSVKYVKIRPERLKTQEPAKLSKAHNPKVGGSDPFPEFRVAE